MNGNLLDVVESFLCNRCQRNVLNGPFFQLEIRKSWCTKRLSIGTLIFSHWYQWFTSRTNIWCPAFLLMILPYFRFLTLQYKTALRITEDIKGSSRDKLFQDYRLEYPQQRRWMRLLSLPHKSLSTGQPPHICNFHKWQILTDTPKLFMYLLEENNTSKTLSFHMSFMNGINLIQTFVALIIRIYFVMRC